MKSVSKNKRGISLIVLVITIIVMIILAAAIILSLNGSNIIGKANEAKTKSDIANAKHVAALAKAEWDLMSKSEQDDIEGGFSVYAVTKLGEAGYKTGAGKNSYAVTPSGQVINSGKNTMYVGSDNRAAIIPEGFAVSTNTAEDTVTEGLVIKDSEGNEFVWVPVDDISKFQRTTTYKEEEGITPPGENYIEPYVTDDYTEEQVEYLAMKSSVEANGGFYIGRYEAGTTVERAFKENGTTEMMVQKGKTPYTYVCWGVRGKEQTGEVKDGHGYNQGLGAVVLSRNMYKDSTSVVSTLCYGVQWDAALRFIVSNKEYEDYLVNYSDKGNFTSKLIKTGSNDNYSACNIYDMNANAAEWTMEFYLPSNYVWRGRNIYSAKPASKRDVGVSSNALDWLGFRPALYIK